MGDDGKRNYKSRPYDIYGPYKSIYTSALYSEKFSEISPEAFQTWIYMLLAADDWGCLEGGVEMIATKVLSKLIRKRPSFWTDDLISKCLQDLDDIGLISQIGKNIIIPGHVERQMMGGKSKRRNSLILRSIAAHLGYEDNESVGYESQCIEMYRNVSKWIELDSIDRNVKIELKENKIKENTSSKDVLNLNQGKLLPDENLHDLIVFIRSTIFSNLGFDSDERSRRKKLNEWAEAQEDAFGALVDLEGEIKKAVAWCKSNPAKMPKSNALRFLSGWFNRAYESARKLQPTNPINRTNDPSFTAIRDHVRELMAIDAREGIARSMDEVRALVGDEAAEIVLLIARSGWFDDIKQSPSDFFVSKINKELPDVYRRAVEKFGEEHA